MHYRTSPSLNAMSGRAYGTSSTMGDTRDLSRFTEAQDADYPTALAELRRGRKQSHWIWYILPQLRGCRLFCVRSK